MRFKPTKIFAYVQRNSTKIITCNMSLCIKVFTVNSLPESVISAYNLLQTFSVAESKEVEVVHLKPPLRPKYFIFKGIFRKK